MSVRVNRATQAWIEAKASRFGCGDITCVPCYPLAYRCDWCGEDFARPILMTRPHAIHACEECYEYGEVLA